MEEWEDSTSEESENEKREKRCECFEINRVNIDKFNRTGTFIERFQALNNPKGARPPPPVSCPLCTNVNCVGGSA